MRNKWLLQVQRKSLTGCIINSMASKVSDSSLQSPELWYQSKHAAHSPWRTQNASFPTSAIVDKTAEGSEHTSLDFILGQPPTNDRYRTTVAAGSNAHSWEIYVSLMEAARSWPQPDASPYMQQSARKSVACNQCSRSIVDDDQLQELLLISKS